jgi:hypothetical protein
MIGPPLNKSVITARLSDSITDGMAMSGFHLVFAIVDCRSDHAGTSPSAECQQDYLSTVIFQSSVDGWFCRVRGH